MLKAAMDSVTEVAPPGIGRRRRRGGRSRRQLDLNISECGKPGSDVSYGLEAGRRRCQKVSLLWEGENFGDRLIPSFPFHSCIWFKFRLNSEFGMTML